MRKTLMEIYDDNWKNENVTFMEALVDVIKEIESRLSALERQPSSLPSPTKVGEGEKNWNPGMGLNDKFREDTLELMNAARAEGYREALEDVVAKFEPLIVEIEIYTNTTRDVSEFAATDVIEMINQMLIAYEKGSDGKRI